MGDYYVYQHINKINGKRYIGLTKQIPESRWGINGNNYKSSPYFWSAIQKYGWNNFEHIVIDRYLTKDAACDLEKTLIKKYQTQNKQYGYNIMEGGTAPSIPAEVRQQMSIAMTGNKNSLGHKCSEEKKRKISAAQVGRHLTDEHKQKLSDAKRGKPHAPQSIETRRKISDSHDKKPVYCKETGIVYSSIQSCAKELGLWATLVCKCCKGKLKSTGGYHFTYYNDTINA